ERVDDVRKLTQKVAFFITPKQDDKDKNKFIPPAVSFIWGSFQFDGIMDSFEETLDFFSEDGKPLRANVTFSLTHQNIQTFTFRGSNAQPEAPGAGTTPLVQAPAGSTLQGIFANAGLGQNWQSAAEANGIENPRLLSPGQLINLSR